MALSAEDLELVDQMQQRELHLKRRQRATDRVRYELRRYQGVVVAVVAAAVALLDVVVIVTILGGLPQRDVAWVVFVASILIAAALGSMVGHDLLGRAWGRRLVAGKERALLRKYAGDLHSGRRWLHFYYRDEDISAYIPQILTFLETGRCGSVGDALALAQESAREKGSLFAERAHALFAEVAGQTNTVIVSNATEAGEPSSRIMRFVRTERPGVWYVTTAPQGVTPTEYAPGQVALVTSPTPDGATITSTDVRIRRAGIPFSDVAALYDAQVPGYTDGMTEDEQSYELVFELTMRSAKVDTWLEHAMVHFDL
ncbi:hypothetical protein [Demequina mangrovi]|uniref:Pyridoxamine 5'-phosphate oxidase n=1 Tax=Demequina mangrovi TaxID=1043493 RepID=A0A1H6TXB5_9MICO|nr:hypothetical protein [Demequina mangrovi]SEI80910.1 hypothetical protein SAMN05421637_0068 [Demequina mangrovi]